MASVIRFQSSQDALEMIGHAWAGLVTQLVLSMAPVIILVYSAQDTLSTMQVMRESENETALYLRSFMHIVRD